MHALFRGVSVIPVLTIERERDAVPLARALFEGSLSLRRELGNKQGIGVTLSTLGHVCLLQGDLETARACLSRGGAHHHRGIGSRHDTCRRAGR